MLTGLRQRGIEPMVTLHHFSTPRWLARSGGWSNVHAIAFFRRFAAYAVQELGDLVNLWCTINEPSVYAFFAYLFGDHAPGRKNLSLSFRVLRHLLQAHAAAYRAIHSIDGSAQVGLVKNIPFFEALDPSDRASVRLTKVIDYLFNELALRAVDDGKLRFPLSAGLSTYGALVDGLDFVGVNYYSRERVSVRGQGEGRWNFVGPTPGAETSDHGRHGTYGEVYPEGLYHALVRASELGKPIYVTENGLPDDDDDQRPRFLLRHLAQVQKAITEGIDVRGYYHWAFTDNFEWAEGWALRFGLVALDETTQVRMPRPSARLYTDIIKANAISPRMVQGFAPETARGLTREMWPQWQR
jgi:beta-glucosidase